MQALTKKEKARAERREAFYAGKRELTLSEKLNGVKPSKNMFVDLSKLKKPILKKKEGEKTKQVENLEKLTRNERSLKAVMAFNDGASSKKAGKMFNISSSSVRYLARNGGVKELKRKIKQEKEEYFIMLDVVKLRKEGKPYTYISIELGIEISKVNTLYKRARRNGLI